MGTSVRSSPSIVVENCKSNPQITMAELGLKKKEVDAINFAFDVYDFKGDGKVDAFYAGDLIRACNLNPTLKTIRRSEVAAPRERSSCPSPMSSPCTRPARTPWTREEAKNLMKELCDPADDDGFIPFKPFLEKMCA